MCFSANASFTAAALLVPAGLYCLKEARQAAKPYWLLAVMPLLFGIQQFIEGQLWLAVAAEDALARQQYALGFMFFSHFFWLFWVPLVCYAVEEVVWRRQVFLALAVIGAMFGASMYLPVLLNESWLNVLVVKHAITYDARLIYDELMPLLIPRVVYAIIVIMPLLMSSEKILRVFGHIIASTVIVTALLFSHAFVSTWCFFAAIASLYVTYVFMPRRYHATIKP
jgi:hypothetical protein